jgi:CarD family transcriptional regulator
MATKTTGRTKVTGKGVTVKPAARKAVRPAAKSASAAKVKKAMPKAAAKAPVKPAPKTAAKPAPKMASKPAPKKAAPPKAVAKATKPAPAAKAAPAKQPVAPSAQPVATPAVAATPAPATPPAPPVESETPVAAAPAPAAAAQKDVPPKKAAPAKSEAPAAAAPAPAAAAQKDVPPKKPAPAKPPAAADANAGPAADAPASAPSLEFAVGDHVVYPTHGVGRVTGIVDEEIAGHRLTLIVVEFEENRMVLRVPVAKAKTAGLRKLSSRKAIELALSTLKGRARIKRTMWSRRAQEYEAKINSGDPIAIAEVVRDLHRNAGQPEQSFSERQIYEQAMDRLAAELAAIEQVDKATAAAKLATMLKAA